MNNAYCFCPKFLAKVPVDSIIEALVLKKNSIILDDKYKLINEYTKVLGDIPDRFHLITLLNLQIPDSQKIKVNVNLKPKRHQ